MSFLNKSVEISFIEALVKRLNQFHWQVEKEPNDGLTDLVVRDPHSDKRIFIEFKDAGQYGELPVSSILSLSKHKNRLGNNDRIFLVSFSDISNMLNRKLDDIGIMAFTKPSVDEVAEKVQFALSA